MQSLMTSSGQSAPRLSEAIDGVKPQGNRHIKRSKTATWVGPSGAVAVSQNFEPNVNILAYGREDRPAR